MESEKGKLVAHESQPQSSNHQEHETTPATTTTTNDHFRRSTFQNNHDRKAHGGKNWKQSTVEEKGQQESACQMEQQSIFHDIVVVVVVVVLQTAGVETTVFSLANPFGPQREHKPGCCRRCTFGSKVVQDQRRGRRQNVGLHSPKAIVEQNALKLERLYSLFFLSPSRSFFFPHTDSHTHTSVLRGVSTCSSLSLFLVSF